MLRCERRFVLATQARCNNRRQTAQEQRLLRRSGSIFYRCLQVLQKRFSFFIPIEFGDGLLIEIATVQSIWNIHIKTFKIIMLKLRYYFTPCHPSPIARNSIGQIGAGNRLGLIH